MTIRKHAVITNSKYQEGSNSENSGTTHKGESKYHGLFVLNIYGFVMQVRKWLSILYLHYSSDIVRQAIRRSSGLLRRASYR